MDKLKKVLVIIPAYNEEKIIKKVVEEIRDTNSNIDIVVINDGSTDNTEIEAKKAKGEVVSLPINLGIGGAVQTGFKYAYQNNYDIAIQIDGDGQHDPKYIKDLLRPILENNIDIVIGSRFINNEGYQSTFVRKLGIKIFQAINSILIKQRITDSTSGIRAYNRKAIELLKDNYPIDYPEPEVIILLGKRNFRIKEIPVKMRSRSKGISSISGIKSLYYMIKVIISIMIEYGRMGDE